MIPLWVGRVGKRWSPNGKGAECPRQRRDPALQLLIKSGLCSSNEFLLLSLNSQTVGGKKEMDPAPNNPPGSSLCPHGGSWGDLFYTDGNATCRFRLRVLYRKSPKKYIAAGLFALPEVNESFPFLLPSCSTGEEISHHRDFAIQEVQHHLLNTNPIFP